MFDPMKPDYTNVASAAFIRRALALASNIRSTISKINEELESDSRQQPPTTGFFSGPTAKYRATLNNEYVHLGEVVYPNMLRQLEKRILGILRQVEEPVLDFLRDPAYLDTFQLSYYGQPIEAEAENTWDRHLAYLLAVDFAEFIQTENDGKVLIDDPQIENQHSSQLADPASPEPKPEEAGEEDPTSCQAIESDQIVTQLTRVLEPILQNNSNLAALVRTHAYLYASWSGTSFVPSPPDEVEHLIETPPKYHGVTRHKGKYYVANAKRNCSASYYLGSFRTPVEAALAYNLAQFLFGNVDDSSLNRVPNHLIPPGDRMDEIFHMVYRKLTTSGYQVTEEAVRKILEHLQRSDESQHQFIEQTNREMFCWLARKTKTVIYTLARVTPLGSYEWCYFLFKEPPENVAEFVKILGVELGGKGKAIPELKASGALDGEHLIAFGDLETHIGLLGPDDTSEVERRLEEIFPHAVIMLLSWSPLLGTITNIYHEPTGKEASPAAPLPASISS